MKGIKIMTVMALFAVPAAAGASEPKPWTLGECISYALEHNITLMRQELNAELDQKDLLQRKLNVLPDLNGQVEHNLGAGRVLDRGTYEWVNTDISQGDLGVVSNMILFNGLTGYNAIRMAESKSEISRAGLERMQNNLQLQVMTGYLDLLQKQELYEIAVEKAGVTALQVERMERMLEVGNASSGDLLEVKAQLSDEQYNKTLAKNALELSRLNLVQLINLEESDSFGIAIPEIPDPALLQIPPVEVVYTNALEALPRIRGAEHRIAYQEKNLAVARGELSPELYVRALYYSNYSDKLINPRDPEPGNPTLDYPVSQQVLDNQYRQVSVGVSIPVFNKWQNMTNISKAKISLEDARYELEDTRQQLFKEIRQYHSDASAALDRYMAAVESEASSEEAFRYAEEKFRVGMATALELEEARNRLFGARAEKISARYVFVFYLEILDFYQGKEMAFN